MIADYHLHTLFSFDSTELMENVCEKAVEQGIDEICFTDHVEFAVEDADKWPDFSEREKKLRECQGKFGNRLSVQNGIEMGQPHRDLKRQAQLLVNHEFDFVIASIHAVTDIGNPSKYSFTKENYNVFFEKYFKDLKEMAEYSDYDVLGHVTLPFRYVPQELLKIYPIDSFKKEYMDIFEILAQRGKGIEINTSGLRTALGETMPSQSIVELFKACGGKIITVGSDGHSSRSAFLGLKEGYRVLKSAGFDKIAHYKKRKCFFEELI